MDTQETLRDSQTTSVLVRLDDIKSRIGEAYSAADDARNEAAHTGHVVRNMAKDVDALSGMGFAHLGLLVLLLLMGIGSCARQEDSSFKDGTLLTYPSKGQVCVVQDGQVVGCFTEGE